MEDYSVKKLSNNNEEYGFHQILLNVDFLLKSILELSKFKAASLCLESILFVIFSPSLVSEIVLESHERLQILKHCES